MCGIAGIVRFDGGAVERPALQRLSAALRHRGPDGEGVYLRRQVGFAHRRLAIIDPEGGHQPFVDQPAGLALTYNGEVYNYKEIRKGLADPERLRTESDTEVVLAAYRERGIRCLDEFRGMFAFALSDAPRDLVYLVRDRIGIKPLYYSLTAEHLIFASEISALMASGLIEGTIDRQSTADYFRYGYVPTPKTIYAHIKKLPAASYLAVDLHSGRATLQRYWSLPSSASPVREEEALSELNALLDDTIRLYLRSDVPFGAFLSGGADSSTVSALVARSATPPLHTFSIGFREEAHSELPHARFVAGRLRTNHAETVLSSRMLQDVLPLIARHCGEPFADSSAIPTYYVSQSASTTVRMVLSGDGGDELFGGYDSYAMAFARRIDGHGKAWDRMRRLLSRLRHGHRAPEEPLQELHDSQREVFRGDSLSRLVGGLETEPIEATNTLRWDAPDAISAFQYQDLCTYLPDDVLTKVDRMSMANSLEVRVPLLDHKVVEFAFALPLRMKLIPTVEGVRTKHLLKLSAERFFPREFLDRKKMGFGIPVVEWLAGDLSALVHETLGRRQHPGFDHIDHGVATGVMKEFYAGRREHAAKLWFLLMFHLWMETSSTAVAS